MCIRDSFGGTLLFYLFEHNRLFAGMSFGEQLLNSFFCTVTPRTAGFNAVDNGALSESSKFLSIVFMFIGGAPGSTAGGVKVTTIFVLLLSVRSTLTRTTGTNIFGRRLEESVITKSDVYKRQDVHAFITDICTVWSCTQLAYLIL